jgi:TolB-like protein/class 3 adenylate cyclase
VGPEIVDRRLTTILSADVAGYSRLMAEDEEGTLVTLGVYRSTIAELVDEHGGRIFGTAGDSVIAEFASPVQAVRCAVAIQRALHRRNEDLPQARRMEFRIGINLGDVMVEGDDLLGDGVNVAARLQEVAAPAGICISGAVREQTDGKTGFPAVHLGERALKNIPRPVPVHSIDWSIEDPSKTGILGGTLALPDRPSIAVLPFVNMSGDPEQEYFADGITEDIITALSQHRWFFVIARNSSFTFKGRAVDVKQVARELGVRYVLEGSVRKVGERVRVTGQLVAAETGAHLWAERYDRNLPDVFAIQDEITQQVAGAIEPAILVGEGRRAINKVETNLDAFDCCMRGMWYQYQLSREDFRKAGRWYRRSIELDPTFHRAHMGLARSLFGTCVFGWSENFERDRGTLCESAERAVSLDDRDPYSHYALFACHLLFGRLQLALAEAQRVIDLNPNFALGHLALGWVRIFMGRFREALDPLLWALRLSPNDPIAFLFTNRVALAHYHMGNYEEAVHFAESALSSRRIHFVLITELACLGQLGRTEEAGLLLDEITRIEPADTDRYWEFSFPYADPTHRAHLIEGLRKAGTTI